MMTDADLFRDYLRTGDRAALDNLFARHYPTVYHVVLKLVRNSADASDLTQETFLKALEAAREGRPPQALRPWLLAAAINAVRDWKRGGRRRRREDWLFEACRRDADGAAPDLDAQRKEFERELEKALEAFPDELTEPLVLHYYQSLSYSEVGEILGLSKTTVQFRLGRAIEQLRERFKSRGLSSLFLLYFPVRPPSTSLIAGLALMNAKKIAVLLLILLGLAAVGRRIWTRAAPSTASHPSADRAALADAARGTRPGATADPASAPGLFGTVFDQATKNPIPGALVTAYDLESAAALETLSDEQGRYRVPCVDERGTWHLKFSRAGYASATAIAAKVSAQPRDAFLSRGGTIQGRVAGPDGVAAGAFRIQAVRKLFTSNEQYEESQVHYQQVLPSSSILEDAQTTYGPDGRFTIPHLRGGFYILLVLPAEGAPFDHPEGQYLKGFPFGIDVREGEVTEVVVPVPKLGSARLRVTDADTHEPIAGASVVPEIRVDRSQVPFPDCRRTTDAAGECVVSARLNTRGDFDWLDLRVSKEGYGAHRESVGLNNPDRVLEIKLGRTGRLEGRVRGPDGRPIENAAVYIAVDSRGSVVGQAFTDAEGRYRTRELPAPSHYSVYLYDPGMRRPRSLRSIVLRSGETRIVDFGPGAGAGISGRVQRQGRPCPRAGICVDWLDGSRRRQVFDADDQGVFAIEGLDPGRYELSINVHDRLHFTHQLTLAEGERKDVPFNVGSRIIRGTVIDAATQAPIQGEEALEVAARAAGSSEPAILVWAGKDGRFELAVEDPGLYEVTLEDANAQFYSTDRLQVDLTQATAAENLRLPAQRDSGNRIIRIRLKDRDSGEPVRQDGDYRFSCRGSWGVVAMGEDVIEHKEAQIGLWKFRVEAEEYLPVRLDLALKLEDREVERTLELRKSDAVKVRSLNAGGAAERAGLRAGDVVVFCNGLRVKNKAALGAVCASVPATQSVTLSVRRGASTLDVVVSAPDLGIDGENALQNER